MNTCINCGKELDYEPERCCNGIECGCMGLPIEPPVCSNECCEVVMGCRKEEKPYSDKDYEDAKKRGLDLDDWNDYQDYYGLGEEPNYDDM